MTHLISLTSCNLMLPNLISPHLNLILNLQTHLTPPRASSSAHRFLHFSRTPHLTSPHLHISPHLSQAYV